MEPTEPTSPVEQTASRPSKRHKIKVTDDDVRRWSEKYRNRISVLKIAREEGVDPETISSRLREAGVQIGMGHHFVVQPVLKVSQGLLEIVASGPDAVRRVVEERVWGVRFTTKGIEQLGKYCQFVESYRKGQGVKEIASRIGVHRSTILKWRENSDHPYLVKLAGAALTHRLHAGMRVLPRTVLAGGNDFADWIDVPMVIESFDSLARVVYYLPTLEDAYARGAEIGLGRSQLDQMRIEFFAYLLGVMVGDASKQRSESEKFLTTNLDLQFTMKRESNQRLGEFVCLAANCLGIKMYRIQDKAPTGYTKISRNPVAAYRWISERSPFLAWANNVCLGLGHNQRTSYDRVRMDWILDSPFAFRKRFVQGLADSDGTVRNYVVEICSAPNAAFAMKLLHSLGMMSAYVRSEAGKELRTVVKAKEAVKLPIFNEFTGGYRLENLLTYAEPT